jgi:hypothetical protein
MAGRQGRPWARLCQGLAWQAEGPRRAVETGRSQGSSGGYEAPLGHLAHLSEEAGAGGDCCWPGGPL